MFVPRRSPTRWLSDHLAAALMSARAVRARTTVAVGRSFGGIPPSPTGYFDYYVGHITDCYCTMSGPRTNSLLLYGRGYSFTDHTPYTLLGGPCPLI